MFEYVKANQAVVITPFLLMGAMSPVSLPATLVQQMAEGLAGIALAQLIRPGAPVVFGSFLSNTDMQSGSPSFGTPESGIGVLCTGQIARRFGLPWRGGGALNASQTVDAQAAYESLMTLLPTFLAGANFVMHSAGWLEGGLVSCYEKFILDVELLRELKHEFTPLEIDEASLAFDAHLEVGAGGHFLGAVHTLERFRECFYRPAALLDRELRPLDQERRPRHHRARGRDLARDARELRAAAARRRDPRRARGVRRPPPGRAGRLTDMVDSLQIEGASGRLDVQIGGPADGQAVVFHTGTPSAGRLFAPMIDAGSERGLRHVVYSRPGYGTSERSAGRSVADCGT